MLFQILAIILLILFYGRYLHKMLTQRRAGIHTDQMGKGKSGLVKWIEVSLKIVTYLTAAAEVVSICLCTTALPVWLRWAGLLLAAAGVVFFALAVDTMRDSWRAGVSYTDKTPLVTSGIFQISRNPAFLGFDLIYAGMVCMFFNLPLLVISAAAGILLHLQIVKHEEPFLREAFGEEYLAYERHVSRYLGRH